MRDLRFSMNLLLEQVSRVKTHNSKQLFVFFVAPKLKTFPLFRAEALLLSYRVLYIGQHNITKSMLFLGTKMESPLYDVAVD